MKRLSIVIPNYNYERFLAAAVESALRVDWPDVQVIVVDDGSTDGSMDVARSFGADILLLQQRNSGPRVACNHGYAHATGDWVIFLDSDDVLDSSIAREIARIDRPGISKIQFQMQRINAEGETVGKAFPRYRGTPSPERVRRWYYRTAEYPTPPGSGNAYSRSFLQQLFPLGDECGDATDSACLAAAPLLGDVVTVPRPLVGYRVHGSNRSYLLADAQRFSGQIDRAMQRHAFAQRLAGRLDDASWTRSLFLGQHLLHLRVSERRLARTVGRLPGDGFKEMLRDCFRTMRGPAADGLARRILYSVWALVALLSPRRIAVALIRRRFAQPT